MTPATSTRRRSIVLLASAALVFGVGFGVDAAAQTAPGLERAPGGEAPGIEGLERFGNQPKMIEPRSPRRRRAILTPRSPEQAQPGRARIEAEVGRARVEAEAGRAPVEAEAQGARVRPDLEGAAPRRPVRAYAAEQRAEAREALAGLTRAGALPPEVRARQRQHARRLARLERIRFLAEHKGDAKTLARIAELEAKEVDRYRAWRVHAAGRR